MKKYILIALLALTSSVMLCGTCHANEKSSLFSFNLVREKNEIVNIKLFKSVAFQTGSEEPLFVMKEPVLDETCIEVMSIRFRKFYTPEMIELINNDPKAKALVKELERKGLTKDEPELFIRFNKKAKAVLAKVTSDNIGKRMAIVIDNKIIVAPIIQEPLVDGEAVINMNKEDMEKFAAKYNDQARKWKK